MDADLAPACALWRPQNFQATLGSVPTGRVCMAGGQGTAKSSFVRCCRSAVAGVRAMTPITGATGSNVTVTLKAFPLRDPQNDEELLQPPGTVFLDVIGASSASYVNWVAPVMKGQLHVSTEMRGEAPSRGDPRLMLSEFANEAHCLLITVPYGAQDTYFTEVAKPLVQLCRNQAHAHFQETPLLVLVTMCDKALKEPNTDLKEDLSNWDECCAKGTLSKVRQRVQVQLGGVVRIEEIHCVVSPFEKAESETVFIKACNRICLRVLGKAQQLMIEHFSQVAMSASTKAKQRSNLNPKPAAPPLQRLDQRPRNGRDSNDRGVVYDIDYCVNPDGVVLVYTRPVQQLVYRSERLNVSYKAVAFEAVRVEFTVDPSNFAAPVTCNADISGFGKQLLRLQGSK